VITIYITARAIAALNLSAMPADLAQNSQEFLAKLA